MRKLQILPGNIANMIAAGEVVQRPSSVVKELVENAVDAGADNISVVVSDCGRTLIKVIDNGCGMSPDDALLCFERHATSKIASAEDLEAIGTYGFRGEALPSIASVAEVTLTTRRASDEMATKVTIADYNHVSTSSVAAPVGTSIAVRNLFFNTPARRKFLKSDAVELRHIIEEFTHIALTRPSTAFSLSHNGKDIFVLKSAKSLDFRISDLMGKGLVSDLMPVDIETSAVKVGGFIGQPGSAKKTVGGQYFFVNGRFFRSPYLHKAVMNAYSDFIPEGLSPAYFIFLEVDPSSMDVNISPTKTEIKFEEDSVIFQTLYAGVKESLGKSSFGARIDFDTEGAVNIPVFGAGFAEFNPNPSPGAELDPLYNPFDSQEALERPSSAVTPSFAYARHPSSDFSALFEDSEKPERECLVVQGRFILTPCPSGLMAVSIRRARERILYDRFLGAFLQGEHITQRALFPVQVQVGAENRLIFDENAELLGRMGFDITPFGNDTIVVGGVPEGYSCEEGKVETMVGDLLRLLSTQDSAALPEVMAGSLAQRFAALGASGAECDVTSREARALLDKLFSGSNSEFTASGHRIISIIPTDELDKRFK